MLGWIKTPLAMEVGLGPGDIVLDRDSALPKGVKISYQCGNVGFSEVVQLFASPTNPAHAENSFYKFGKNYAGCQQCVHKY